MLAKIEIRHNPQLKRASGKEFFLGAPHRRPYNHFFWSHKGTA